MSGTPADHPPFAEPLTAGRRVHTEGRAGNNKWNRWRRLPFLV